MKARNPGSSIFSRHKSFSIEPFPSSEANAHDLTIAHAHQYFQFIWIEKGNGLLLVDAAHLPVEEGSICLIRPEEVRQIVDGENLKGFIISFTDAFFQLGETEFNLFYHSRHFGALRDPLSSVAPTKQIIHEIVQKMKDEYSLNQTWSEYLLRRYFKIFLLYVFRELDKKHRMDSAPISSQLVQHFLQLINEQFLEKKLVADYAGQLSVTPNYLNAITKRVTGYAAGYHIRQRILTEIQRKVIYSNATMKEIAYSIGFTDPAHFSKYFKSVTGMNFTAYKSTLKRASC